MTCSGFAQAGGGYGGPSILSRGVGQAGRRGAETVRFRLFARVSGIYDSGLTPVVLDDTGALLNFGSYGVQGTVGAYGYHQWRRSSLGLEYRGDYRHYTNNTFFNGSDHFLSLNHNSQLSRRVTLSLTPTIGTSSRIIGGFVPLGLSDPNDFVLPNAELFDGRTNFGQANAVITWQKSARLSFSGVGRGFAVRRRSAALTGVNGYSAGGDVGYRLGRNQTIVADYSFIHFDFTNLFGATDIHQVGLNYGHRLSRYWELNLRAGLARVESLSTQRVYLDPMIAALIGQRTAFEAVHRINKMPVYQGDLTRYFRQSTLRFSYGQMMRPGNGIFLTARQKIGGAFFGYTGIRRWNLVANFNYSEMDGMHLVQGSFRQYGGGGGATYRITNILHLDTRYDLRRANLFFAGFERTFHRAAIGLTFSPGELPVALW
ncbi:MAG: hypothetical protein ACK5AZ_12755 [Bryobacteraceae bacterium]